jgi:hypothetical protein
VYTGYSPVITEVNLLGRIGYSANIEATCLGVFLLMGGLVALRSKPLVLDFSCRKS